MKRSHGEIPQEDCQTLPKKARSANAATEGSWTVIKHAGPGNGQLEAHQNSKMCAKCEEINFSQIFALSSRQFNGVLGHPVTEFRQDWDSTCALCLLVASLYTYERSPARAGCEIRRLGYFLVALDSRTVLRLPRPRSELESVASIVVVVIPGRPEDDKSFARRNDAILRGLIVPLASECSLTNPTRRSLEYHGMIVKPSQMNLERVRSWIDDCESTNNGIHKKCRHHAQSRDLKSKVIDCLTRKIVPMTEGMRYVTLSYMWGKPQQDDDETASQEETGDSLPANAPKTIEDAVFVVLKLQERYLWVDRFCIQGTLDKHLQIRSMDQTYEGAIFTIVAMTGRHSESGLCGVSSPRTDHLQVKIDGAMLVGTGRHLSYHFSVCEWAKRGWTYQDTFLAKRCLFFTPDEVVFVCRTLACSESVLRSPQTYFGKLCLLPTKLTLAEEINFRTASLKSAQLKDHIKEYTTRDLTYDSDSLNAFRGLLARHSHPSYWGIPLLCEEKRITCVDASFARGLCWQSLKCLGDDAIKHRRRPGFPTWSWAAVEGQITYSNLRFDRPRGSKIFLEDSEGTLKSVAHAINIQGPKEKMIPEQTHYLHISGPVIKWRLIRTPSHLQTEWMCEPVDAGFPKGLQFLFIDIIADESFAVRLETELWDAIELCKGGFDSHWLLLDWNGSTAHRIGLIRYSWPPSGNQMQKKLGNNQHACMRLVAIA